MIDRLRFTMSLNQVLPFITTTIMFVFAGNVIMRYMQRHSMHLLMWAIGLTLFAIGSLTEALSLFGYNDLVFRLWYLCGAVLTAAWIGQGTIYLLLRRRWGNITLAILAVLSLAATAIMIATPLDGSHFDPKRPLSDQYASKQLAANEAAPAGAQVVEQTVNGVTVRVAQGIIPLGAPIRATTAIFNIYGSLALIGGALYSTYLFWRKRVMGNRVIGNILIAAGALSIASASTLTRLGLGEFLYVGELVAAVIMFAGFVAASRRGNDTLEREPAPSMTQPAASS
jgi:uncharacterized membrane protein HdeD (DUF308 family)